MIDSHAHLTHISLQGDVRSLLQRASDVGIDAIINICTTPLEVEKGLQLAREYPWIFTAAATTPHDVAQEGESAFAFMEKHALQGDLIAVGETGLDYHYYLETKEIQQLFLRRYFQLAKRANLPVIIHCREAFSDFFHILDEEYQGYPGVLHCFTGTLEEAHEVIQRGWYLSLSGITTFKKSYTLHEVAQMVPIDRLLIETDSPYLAPMPYRGKQNEPAYLLETAKFIAQLRGMPLEALQAATAQNTHALFKLVD